MNDKLRSDIARRVAEHKQGLDDAAAMSAHVAALADVYGVERSQVEAIAARAAVERSGPGRVLSRTVATLSRFQILVGFAVAACIIVGGAWGLSNYTAVEGETAGRVGAGITASAEAQHRRASIAASILAEINPIRIMVVEHYLAEGRYPRSFEAIGLRRDDMRTARFVADTVLGPAGEIIVKSDDSPGEPFYLVLVPEQRMGGMSVHWNCRSSTEFRHLGACSAGDVTEYLRYF